TSIERPKPSQVSPRESSVPTCVTANTNTRSQRSSTGLTLRSAVRSSSVPASRVSALSPTAIALAVIAQPPPEVRANAPGHALPSGASIRLAHAIGDPVVETLRWSPDGLIHADLPRCTQRHRAEPAALLPTGRLRVHGPQTSLGR